MKYFPSLQAIPVHGVLISGEDYHRTPFSFSKESVHIDDITISMIKQEDDLAVSVTAEQTPISWIMLRFPCTMPAESRIYGDAWERGYGDLCWNGIVPERHMPWYFLAYQPQERILAGYGVKVQPGAMCVWHLDGTGMTLFLDVRSGGAGVILGGRTLQAATILCREYENTDAFTAGHAFCRAMCPNPIFPKEPVYGSNNWYYAYGVSSRAEILADTDYIAALTEGIGNRPYMVIDDGWQKNSCAGPWDNGNDAFGNMQEVAQEMRRKGVKPGLWVRLLYDGSDAIPEDWRLSRDRAYLDPSHPAVREHIQADIRRFTNWGFSLIKHDYSGFDLFGRYGMDMSTSITNNGWHFYDRTKTSAEVVLDFYRAIREAAGNTVIIGCNTFSHLCAGLVEVNRTGDDTSGREWNRTRNRGVNTLAFRMMQNHAFYMADADCIGITNDVPWAQNRMWLKALSRSGSPLFMSSAKGVADETMLPEIKEAFRYNAEQKDILIPLNWLDDICPSRWLLNGEEIVFDWYDEMGFHAV